MSTNNVSTVDGAELATTLLNLTVGMDLINLPVSRPTIEHGQSTLLLFAFEQLQLL